MHTAHSLLVLACLAPLARAQDSVSKLQALPGDAVSSFAASDSINDYVVDMTALRSSWGNTFGIAPIAKTGLVRDTAPNFFNKAMGAQSLSRSLKSNVPFARGSYSVWSGQGFGIHDDPARNDPGTPLATAGQSGYQFGYGFAEFGSGTTDPAGNPASLNNLVGGVVNFTDARPSRLYVTRVNAAVNAQQESCNLSQFGMGGVDEDGHLHARVEGFGASVCGGLNPITGNNLLRIRTLHRTAIVNVISAAGGIDAAACDFLLSNSAVTHNTPAAVSTLLAGRPLLIGSNFNREFVAEQVAGTATAAPANAHFAAGIGDHRGAVGYTPANFPALFPGSAIGTAAILARSTGSGFCQSLNLWGLGANGGIVNPRALALPATISDPVQTWSNTDLAGSQEFDHYHSQTAFRGGNAQVALGQDQAGNLLAAGVVYYGFTPPSLAPFNNPNNYIAVAKTDAAGATSWTVAAWTKQSTTVSDGKTIFQNGSTPIGRLTGSAFGPALSGAMIDSVGNVWFLGQLVLDAAPASVVVGLIRAVLDPASFSYQLELVFKQGDVVRGQNSNTDYLIRFLEIADADSVSSGTAYSGNISAAADRNAAVVGLLPSSNRTLGGLLINASILYDTNGDGQFIRSTGSGGDPASPDEDYQVLLYVGAATDCNQNGVPDDKELAEGLAADLNGNGTIDSCEGLSGLVYCEPGVAGVLACPCGNPPSGPARGCDNSLGTGGAALHGSGIAQLTGDSLVLSATAIGQAGAFCSGSITNVTSILLQGTAQVPSGLGFGDGVRCVGGTLKRINTSPSAAGTYSFGPGIAAQSASLGDPLSPGLTRYYLVYYRDACSSFCPSANFNASNGLRVLWVH